MPSDLLQLVAFGVGEGVTIDCNWENNFYMFLYQENLLILFLEPVTQKNSNLLNCLSIQCRIEILKISYFGPTEGIQFHI
jgi:hypothetical protein